MLREQPRPYQRDRKFLAASAAPLSLALAGAAAARTNELTGSKANLGQARRSGCRCADFLMAATGAAGSRASLVRVATVELRCPAGAGFTFALDLPAFDDLT